MHFVIDLLIIVTVILISVRFYRTGILRTVIGVGKFIIAALLAAHLGETVALSAQVSVFVAYAAIFLVSLVLFSLIPFVFDRIKVPIFSRVDRAIGLILGIFTGVFVASLISSAIYSSLELVSSFGIAEDAMRAYGDSTVFKFMHRLDISRLV